MAIVQSNLYMPGRNLTNLAANVDYNRLGTDKTQITVDYGVVPARVTVLVGSIIECNGNLYIIQGADEVFDMANAAHNYLTFTDNPAPAFSSAAAIGTFTAEKQGYYQAGNLVRTLKFFIDQAGEYSRISLDITNPDITISTQRFDRIRVGMSAQHAAGRIALDNVYDDALGSWDAVNYEFVCAEAGWYYISKLFFVESSVRVNNVNRIYSDFPASIVTWLDIGDIVIGHSAFAIPNSGEAYNALCIARLL